MSKFQDLLDWLNAPQTARLLRISYPNEDAPSARLRPNRFRGVEHISRGFEYTVELLSDDAGISLEEMHGKLLCISLVQANGSLRPFTGYVTQFKLVRTDGGTAFFEAILVPWLEFLRLRQNNRVFPEQNLHEQVQTILSDYPGQAQWEWKVSADDPVFTMAVQYGETDHNTIGRRLEHAGFSYHFEHTEHGHTWVVGSDTCAAQPIDGLTVRYHGQGGSEAEDAIAHWSPVRRSTSAHVTVSGFDFKNPVPVHAGVPTLNRQGAIPALEVHRYEGHYGFKHAAGADALAQRRMIDLEARGLQYAASGNCDRFVAGRYFAFVGHFGHKGEQAEFLVTQVVHEASNNYLQNADEPAAYTSRILCQPRAVPWQPGLGFNSTETRILAPQTATVVGPDGAGSLHVDQYGRVRIKFHWDRDQTRSCWVRVSSHWAGGENGLSSHPRVGSEAVIQFLDGNPDHPLITGCVHNRHHMPPWKLPEQKALTGLRSRELKGSAGNSPGGRSNHLVLDDTPAKLQAQLKSDHLSSQLSLGHITRIEDNAGRKDERGQGFELRTDGCSAMRSGQGLLITTESRPNAEGHITDMAETVERLTLGHDLHDHLANTAQQAQAHEAGDQDDVVKALKTQASEIKGQGGDPSQGRFPEFQAPHLTLASPAGIQSTTQGSTHVASVAHNALTSGGHTSVSAGRSFLVSVKGAVRMFAYSLGMKLIAAAGDIDITALKNSINLLAKLNITHVANKITISAAEELELIGGGSFSKYNASGIEHGTDGAWRQQAASHHISGPASAPAPKLPEPIGLTDLVHKQSLAFTLRSHPEGPALVHEAYSLYKNGAKVEDGVTDGSGRFVIKDHQQGDVQFQYAVKLANGHEIEIPVKAQLDAPNKPAARGLRDA